MCFKSPHRQSSKLQICTSLHKTKQRKKKEKEQKHSQSFTRPSSKFLKTNFCQSIFNFRSKNSMVKGISVKTKKKKEFAIGGKGRQWVIDHESHEEKEREKVPRQEKEITLRVSTVQGVISRLGSIDELSAGVQLTDWKQIDREAINARAGTPANCPLEFRLFINRNRCSSTRRASLLSLSLFSSFI